MRQQRYNTDPRGQRPATEKALSGTSNQEEHNAKREGVEPVAGLIGRSVKVGRNAKCGCGSGKKYKQCCGGKR